MKFGKAGVLLSSNHAPVKKTVTRDLPLYEGERPDWWTERDEAELEAFFRAPQAHGTRHLQTSTGRWWNCRKCVYWLSRDGRGGGCHLYGLEAEPLATKAEDGCRHWLPHRTGER